MTKQDKYNINILKRSLFDYLNKQYKTKDGKEIQGDEYMFGMLFEIMATGSSKEKIQASTLIKEFMCLFEKTGIL